MNSDPDKLTGHSRLSVEFHHLARICDQEGVTYADVLDHVSTRGHGLLTLFLCLPFLTPVPLPGLSTIFGLSIAFVGFQLVLDKKPWLPRSWLRKNLPRDIFRKIFSWCAKGMEKIEILVRPRGTLFVRAPAVRQLTGLLIVALALVLALPLPPGTNFPPASGIFVLSVAVLEEDWMALALGFLIFAGNVLFFAALSVLGYEGVRALIQNVL